MTPAASACPREAGAAPGCSPSASRSSSPSSRSGPTGRRSRVAGAIALTLVAAARWQLRWLPVVVLVAVRHRPAAVASWAHEASDVADVTRSAIHVMLARRRPVRHRLRRLAPAWARRSRTAPSRCSGTCRSATTRRSSSSSCRSGCCATSASAPRTAARSGSRSSPSRRRSSSRRSTARTTRAPACSSSRRSSLGVRSGPSLGAAVLAVAVAFKPYAVAWLPPLVAVGRAARAPRLRRGVGRRLGAGALRLGPRVVPAEPRDGPGDAPPGRRTGAVAAILDGIAAGRRAAGARDDPLLRQRRRRRPRRPRVRVDRRRDRRRARSSS